MFQRKTWTLVTKFGTELPTPRGLPGVLEAKSSREKSWDAQKKASAPIAFCQVFNHHFFGVDHPDL